MNVPALARQQGNVHLRFSRHHRDFIVTSPEGDLRETNAPHSKTKSSSSQDPNVCTWST